MTMVKVRNNTCDNVSLAKWTSDFCYQHWYKTHSADYSDHIVLHARLDDVDTLAQTNPFPNIIFHKPQLDRMT